MDQTQPARQLRAKCDKCGTAYAARVIGQDCPLLWDDRVQCTGTCVEHVAEVRPLPTLAAVERDAIVARLIHHGGRREATARSLGIGVRTLGMKLRAWGMTGWRPGQPVPPYPPPAPAATVPGDVPEPVQQ